MSASLYADSFETCLSLFKQQRNLVLHLSMFKMEAYRPLIYFNFERNHSELNTFSHFKKSTIYQKSQINFLLMNHQILLHMSYYYSVSFISSQYFSTFRKLTCITDSNQTPWILHNVVFNTVEMERTESRPIRVQGKPGARNEF